MLKTQRFSIHSVSDYIVEQKKEDDYVYMCVECRFVYFTYVYCAQYTISSQLRIRHRRGEILFIL